MKKIQKVCMTRNVKAKDKSESKMLKYIHILNIIAW